MVSTTWILVKVIVKNGNTKSKFNGWQRLKLKAILLEVLPSVNKKILLIIN